ncbi:hypothetical protein GALMADRAFT_929086 [Galerina marginata CBS 339.88]|uniref:DUF6533 domain-containing protein n=1 Tax=Galerina marginata (strain CBS 339.88) TaxID=685588 RepID=A0A067SEJ7_GALM3|nr:hypothetical protein GALMADRAFT_929086 [Galerina marginata CBS 339.88]
MNAASVEWLFADRALALLYLSTATCVVYDHITTLDVEVELIWKRPKRTAVQLLFFLNRYVGDGMQLYGAFVFVRHIVMHTNRVCHFIAIILGYLNAMVLSSMQAIMIFRVSGMYNNDRRVTTLLFVALVLELAGIAVVQIVASRFPVPIPEPAPGVSPCSGPSSPHWMYIWIPIVCFELLVLCLSLSRAIQHYRSIGVNRKLPWLSLTQWHNPECLTYILLRDSITFPFISLVICITNIFVSVRLPVRFHASSSLHMIIMGYVQYIIGQMGICVASFSPCIVGSRLILNLREAYYQPFVYECNVGTSSDDGVETDGFMNNLDLNDIPNVPINNLVPA